MRRFRLDGLTTVKPFRLVWATEGEEDIPPPLGNQHATLRETSFWGASKAFGWSFREECHARYVQPGKYRDCLYSASRSVTVAAFEASKECSVWTNDGGS